MNKILVSDLYGTLISDDEDKKFWTKDGYFDGEKNTIKLINDLSDFLNGENYLYIVSGGNNHDGADFTYEEIIKNIYKFINEKNKDKIYVFFQGEETIIDNQLKKMKKVSDGNYLKFLDDNTSLYYVSEKEKVYDFILDRHDISKYELFSIGDSENDVNMLNRCVELGGVSTIINETLNYYEKNSNNIKRAISKKVSLLRTIAYNNYVINNNIDYFDETIDENIPSYNELYIEISKKIDELLLNGDISKNDIYAMGIYSEILENYLEKRVNYSIMFDEKVKAIELPEHAYDFSVYPDFNTYQEKVLKNKSKLTKNLLIKL